MLLTAPTPQLFCSAPLGKRRTDYYYFVNLHLHQHTLADFISWPSLTCRLICINFQRTQFSPESREFAFALFLYLVFVRIVIRLRLIKTSPNRYSRTTWPTTQKELGQMPSQRLELELATWTWTWTWSWVVWQMRHVAWASMLQELHNA